ETELKLAGYELRLALPDGFAMERAETGDALGGYVFSPKPVAVGNTTTLSSVQLDLAQPQSSERGNVLARLFVVGLKDASPSALKDAVRFRDIQLSDANGDLVGFRLGEPIGFARPTMANALMQNYPNPFNPETWIPFRLAEDSDVTITIYDMQGKTVRSLELGRMGAGDYSSTSKAAHWDGRNVLGERVASGVYIYRLIAGSHMEMRRLVVLK
ncbi:MAG: T9SS type A sorting domain-containing protein, partial [Candidatus Poribacteria bacterium]|nr:T9SS type A sorting domain-containing protein [Candidatus Poribacteria bacterium]